MAAAGPIEDALRGEPHGALFPRLPHSGDAGVAVALTLCWLDWRTFVVASGTSSGWQRVLRRNAARVLRAPRSALSSSSSSSVSEFVDLLFLERLTSANSLRAISNDAAKGAAAHHPVPRPPAASPPLLSQAILNRAQRGAPPPDAARQSRHQGSRRRRQRRRRTREIKSELERSVRAVVRGRRLYILGATFIIRAASTRAARTRAARRVVLARGCLCRRRLAARRHGASARASRLLS